MSPGPRVPEITRDAWYLETRLQNNIIKSSFVFSFCLLYFYSFTMDNKATVNHVNSG